MNADRQFLFYDTISKREFMSTKEAIDDAGLRIRAHLRCADLSCADYFYYLFPQLSPQHYDAHMRSVSAYILVHKGEKVELIGMPNPLRLKPCIELSLGASKKDFVTKRADYDYLIREYLDPLDWGDYRNRKWDEYRNRIMEDYHMTTTIDNLETQIKDVKFSKNKKNGKITTIIFWKDGTKTMATPCDSDKFDPFYGFDACVLKKIFKNNSHHKKVCEKWTTQPLTNLRLTVWKYH